MDQDDALPGSAGPWVELEHGLDHVVDLSHCFHAAESASNGHERQRFPAGFPIRFGVRFFELAQDVIAQVKGVAHRLDGKRVFQHAGGARKIHPQAKGENQMVKAQCFHAAPVTSHKRHQLPVRVDRFHGRAMKPNVGTELANRIEDVAGFNPAGNDLRQQRLEDEVVLVTHQMHFDRPIAPGPAAQLDCGRDPGEASPQNDDSGRSESFPWR